MSNDSEIDCVGILRREIVKFVSSCNFKMSKSNVKIRTFRDIFGYVYIFDNALGRMSCDLYRIKLNENDGFDVVEHSERLVSVGWVFKEEHQFPGAISDFVLEIEKVPEFTKNFDGDLAALLTERGLDSLALYKFIADFPSVRKYMDFPLLMYLIFQNIGYIKNYNIVCINKWLIDLIGLDLSDKDVVRMLLLIQSPCLNDFRYEIKDDPFEFRDSVLSVTRDLKKLSRYCVRSEPVTFDGITHLRFILDAHVWLTDCAWFNIDVSEDYCLSKIEATFSIAYRLLLDKFDNNHGKTFSYIKGISSFDRLLRVIESTKARSYSRITHERTFNTLGLRSTSKFQLVQCMTQLIEISKQTNVDAIRLADRCIVGDSAVLVRSGVAQQGVTLLILDRSGFPPMFTTFFSGLNTVPTEEVFNDAKDWVLYNSIGMEAAFVDDILFSLNSLRKLGTIYPEFISGWSY